MNLDSNKNKFESSFVQNLNFIIMKKITFLLCFLFAIALNAQTPIQEFNFSNSLTNQAGTVTLTGAGFTYQADRNGVANSAVKLAGGANDFLIGNLSNLPLGNTARTISFWLKLPTIIQGKTYLFSYGTQANNAAFGVDQRNSATLQNPNAVYIYGYGTLSSNVFAVAPAITSDVWYHYVVTHDGVNTTKLYRNNVLLQTFTKTWATVGTNITIGRIVNGAFDDVDYRLNGIFDDLKIYDTALTATQISNLYSPISLPIISNVTVASLIHEGANISYTVNAGGDTTYTTLLYGVTNAANELAAQGTNATGTSNTSCTAIAQYNSTPFAAPPGTTMYYRVQASNSVGDVFSPTYTYIQVTKPTMQLNNATNLTSVGVTLNYFLNPNGANTTSVIKFGTSIGTYPNTAAGFSAVGFTQNFSGVTLSGLNPATTYYFIIEGTNQYGVTQTAYNSFTTQGNAPTLSNVNVSGITQNGATVNYSLNAGGTSSTTTVINYGLSSSALTSTIAGPVSNSNTSVPFSVNLSSLSPSTLYYYQVVSTGNGSTSSTIQSFTTAAPATIPTPIYNFEFNNNLQSQDGSVLLNTPFNSAQNGSFSFVSNGTVTNGALQLDSAYCDKTLPLLPIGAATRTINIRIKFLSGALSTENYVFTYGTAANGQAFSFSQSATQAKFIGWGGNSFDLVVPNSSASFNIYYDYTIVYNATSITVYRDGTLLGTLNTTLNTSADRLFRIGRGANGIYKLQADIDYIRIFSQALDASQVTLLNSNPSLAVTTNQVGISKFNLYPNPATDIVNITMENEVKLVEVYSLQGQKVLTSDKKQINVSELSQGLYLVQVTDENGTIATQKLIKNK